MMIDRRLWGAVRQSRFTLFLTILLSAAGGGMIIAQAFLLSQVVATVFLEGSGLATVSRPFFLLLLTIIGRAMLAWGRDVSAGHIAAGIKAELRASLFVHLQARGPVAAGIERTGELTAVISDGVDTLEAYFSQYLPQLVVAVLVPLTILAVTFPTDWLSALILLLTAPLLPLFMILIGRYAAALTRRQWGQLSRMSAHFLDVMQGLRTLKQLGRAQQQAENIAAISDQFRRATLDVLRVAFLSALALELVASISTAVVAVSIGLRLLNGSLAFGTALFILILTPEFYGPLRLLGQRFHAGMDGVTAANRIFALLNQPLPGPPVIPCSLSLPASICLENVSVAYREGTRPALRDVSFTIQPDQTIVLVGSSGAGKSTVAALLLGFLQPDEGQITVGGKPLAAEGLRDQIAWAPQRPYLFHDTIAANIRLARPEALLSDVISAARQARLHTFIESLPAGYETIIGEDGARLSGGQAQRLALARAFLKDSPLLILDEPTSQLDPATEADLQAASAALMRGRAALIIAHRLGTVTDADQIVVLHDGRVAEIGAHEELLAQNGRYAHLLQAAAPSPSEHPSTVSPAIENNSSPHLITQATKGGPSPHLSNRRLSTSSPQKPSVVHPFTSARRAPSPRHARRLLAFLRPYAGRVALAILLGTLTIGSSIGLMGTASYLISAAALRPSIADLNLAIVGVRFFGVSRGVFRYLERLVSHGVTFRLLARLRVWFYQAVEPLAPARLTEFRGGDLLSRVVSDVETLQEFYVRGVGPPLVALAVAGGMTIFFAGYAPRLALVLLGFLLLAGIGAPLLTHRLSRERARAAIAERAALQTSLVDGIQGMADVQAYGRTADRIDEVTEQTKALADTERRLAWVDGFYAGLSDLLAHGATWMILWLAIPLVAAGAIDGVHLAGLALMTLAAFEAVQPLPEAARQVGGSLAAAQRLFAIVDTEPPVKPPLDPISGPCTDGEANDHPTTPSPGHPVTLTIHNLHFTYPGASQPALIDLSLHLPPGKKMAIVGPSGAGKSTLLNLLFRFWPYERGQIHLGESELRAYLPTAVRRCFGVIAQRPHLFNATVGDNLRLARPAAGAAAITEAARLAQLHETIQALSDGYETEIGEQGLQLSGGERQRLAIARALVAAAPILLLDEPTANLDPVTERQILRTVLALPGAVPGPPHSLLLITHRLVEMEQMDEILVLDAGRVVERGRHAALLARRGLYHRLWSLQESAI